MRELRQTGSLPVLAVTTVRGRAPERKIVTLTTPVPPTVIAGTGHVLGVSGGSAAARLSGAIVPHADSVTYHFEYGPTPAYGQTTARATSNSHSKVVSATVEGLTPGATYHFRLVATTAGGTKRGPDATFTVPADVTPPPGEEEPP